MSFAVIKTGGKQYKVAEGEKILIEKIPEEAGKEVVFDQVLLVDDQIGTPLVHGAKVTARGLKQGRADKKIVFKFHHKTRYKKKKGHRQPFTQVQIESIAVS